MQGGWMDCLTASFLFFLRFFFAGLLGPSVARPPTCESGLLVSWSLVEFLHNSRHECSARH